MQECLHFICHLVNMSFLCDKIKAGDSFVSVTSEVKVKASVWWHVGSLVPRAEVLDTEVPCSHIAVPELTRSLGTCSCPWCPSGWRSHRQFMEKTEVVVCLNSTWSFHRTLVKSDTSMQELRSAFRSGDAGALSNFRHARWLPFWNRLNSRYTTVRCQYLKFWFTSL